MSQLKRRWHRFHKSEFEFTQNLRYALLTEYVGLSGPYYQSENEHRNVIFIIWYFLYLRKCFPKIIFGNQIWTSYLVKFRIKAHCNTTNSRSHDREMEKLLFVITAPSSPPPSLSVKPTKNNTQFGFFLSSAGSICHTKNIGIFSAR